MALKLVLYPDMRLKLAAVPVTRFGDKLLSTFKQMEALMWKENGIGISAQQCGLIHRLVVVYNPDTKKIYYMCNPEVLNSQGSQEGQEGCLSFPDLWIEQKRPVETQIKYQTWKGKETIINLSGIGARCVLHEIEHLDGILLNDSEELKVSGDTNDN